MLQVIDAGLYSTVQDMGRPGYGHLGVRHAGAADDLALFAANMLVGNEPDAAALEMTLLGATFEVRADCLVGIAGADMEARVVDDDRLLRPGRSHLLQVGTTLWFGGATDGARTYLALAGGVAAQDAFGSAATDPIAGFGGIDGRPLAAGDVIAAPQTEPREEREWPAGVASSGVAVDHGPRTLAIVPGPHLEALPGSVGERLVSDIWTVTPRSDRVGLRLSGDPITEAASIEVVSLAMLPGAIQLPPNGQPIVLMADAPTVGGYPVPGVVAEADRYVCGQLRPGDEVRFEWIDAASARQRAATRSALLQDLIARRW
jgi:biotin-dependent carboxylase-like uncharacterized protein